MIIARSYILPAVLFDIDVKNVGEKIKNVKKRKKRGKNKKTFKNVIKNVDATVIWV